ncbi:pro-resilin-like isoform X2 [Macrobrachium rosenbergii]|uniref:pro-resilin-like isoform X2 n=1 Tax=Macrobrachium rosenbergii TaxID=79674 RepID=UPI0034D647DD
MPLQVVFALLGLVALVAADSFESFERYSRPRFSSGSAESFESGEARYNFNWAVNHGPSRNDFGHQEQRNEDETQGSYYVHLPDGRLQKVAYRVDGGEGYIADVTYSGEAQFPDSFESYESREAPRRFYYGSGSNESK